MVAWGIEVAVESHGSIKAVQRFSSGVCETGKARPCLQGIEAGLPRCEARGTSLSTERVTWSMRLRCSALLASIRGLKILTIKYIYKKESDEGMKVLHAALSVHTLHCIAGRCG